MAFKMSVQKYSGKISEVEIGKGEKAIKIGGESTLPFYSFDGNIGNTQKVGVEMLDVYPEGWTNEFKEMYKDVCDCPVKWAKYIEENLKADFICLKLESSDPNGLDRSPEECAEVAKNVVESVSLPVVIAGCGNHEKDAKVFEKVSQAIAEVKQKGYGVVTPKEEEIQLDEPVVIKHGNKYGIKIKANAPSIHMISANIETEVAPIVGTEEQAKELIEYIQTEGKNQPESIREILIFGKSIGHLVNDGISAKVDKMTEESQMKMQESLQKIINDSNGGVIFIII